MRGTIALSNTSLRNRRGRKRKQRIKLAGPGGAIVSMAEPQVDYTALTANQPHRVNLPERFRLDSRAGTFMGELLLTGRLSPHERDGKPSQRALALHEAGRRYAAIVGNYRTMIGAPGKSAGAAGKGYACLGERYCGLDPKGKRIAPCECKHRTDDYDDAYKVLALAGHMVHVVVNRVAVHDEPCADWQVPALIIGLGTLAREFGLKS